MKTIRLLLLLAALAASSVKAEEIAAETFAYQNGQVSAFLEAPSVITPVLPGIISFRAMALNNRLLADLFRWTGDLQAAFYFEGRTSVFEALALLYPSP